MLEHSATTLITPPATEVVTVADMHAQGRVSTSAEDSLVTRYIVAARRSIEAEARRQFITATYEYSLDRFPWGIIKLPLPPIQSLTWIKYLDMSGNLQTLDSSTYVVDLKSEPARIMPDFGKVFPVTRPIFNAVTIRFVAGYGDNPADVPATYHTAIQLFAQELYEHREATTDKQLFEVPLGIKRLLATESWGGYF